MIRKLLSLVLCLLMLVSVVIPLVSCGTTDDTTATVTTKTPGNTDNTTAADTSTDTTVADTAADTTAADTATVVTTSSITTADPTTVEKPTFEKFSGSNEITFAYTEGANGDFTARSISVTEEDAMLDNLNKEIFERNAGVEEELGVTIISKEAGTTISDLSGTISPALKSGDGEIDVVAGYMYFDIELATQGLLVNLNSTNSYDTNFNDYIHEDRAYWSTNFINAIQYKNSMYWLTGDLSLRYIGGMYCTYVNKTIYDTYCTDVTLSVQEDGKTVDKTFATIYDIVSSGHWTLDALDTLAGKVYIDSGEIADKTDEADQLGFAIERQDPMDGIAFGCEIQFSTVNTDKTSADYNKIVLTVNNDNTIALGAKLDKILKSRYALVLPDSDSVNTMETFAAGKLLFAVNKVYQAEVFLNSMEDDFYIIPAPKLNDAQGEYATGIHDGLTIFGIPISSDSKQAAAATLELLAYTSYLKVAPMYYANNLSTKYTRDERSPEMIDLIRSNVRTDFVSSWSHGIQNIVQLYRDVNLATLQTRLKKLNASYKNDINKICKLLDKYATE